MNYSVWRALLVGAALAILLAAPAAAESSVISAISPEVGYTGGSTTVTITGSDFNTTSVVVRLMMEDESNITATIVSYTSTTIVCKFTLSSSKEKGDWDLVVINEDESEAVASGGFTIRKPMTLSSITPEEYMTNEEEVEFTVTGTGLADVSDLYLYNTYYGKLSADIDDIDSTEITGFFDLTDMTDGSYEVCVEDDFGTEVCDLDFEVTTDELGEIDVSSSPTGASIYVDSEYMGTTPDVVEDVIIGYHKVTLVKAGYNDWEKLVKVTAGDTTTVDADLETTTVATVVRTADPTTVPTTVPTTAVTKKVTSSITVPTPWPTDTATSQESPGEIAVVVGAVAVAGLVAARRKQQ
jgi:hypothetical protein